jgi:hypothetical protein
MDQYDGEENKEQDERTNFMMKRVIREEDDLTKIILDNEAQTSMFRVSP